mmetsp:Transcript_13744/g.26328  ORF Transcript_13744/g.26328 Transcript_13744/m.26328 type:complete len:393 (-) Transcript_13744:106-1284(-)
MVLLAVNDMFLHELVQLVEVIEGHHWIAMMFGVKISVPKKNTSDDVGSDRPSVSEAVGDLGDFAIGVFKVTDVVDDRVANEDGDNPPKEDGLQPFTSLADGRCNGNVERQLHEGSTLKFLHDARFLGVVEFLKAPASARVVDSHAHGRKDDAAGAALEGGKDVQELHDEGKSTRRQVTESWVFKGLARVEAGKFRVLVNVVGVGVVLLVHDAFVFAKFKAKEADKEQGPVIDPLGLPGIAMKELMLSSKSKGLKLETIKEVERDEHGELLGGKLGLVKGKDVHLMNRVDGSSHDGQVYEETLEALVVGLFHESDKNAIVKDTIALLAFTVLDIGPVFVVGINACETVGVGMLVEDVGQNVFDGRFFVLLGFFKENCGHTCIRRHGGGLERER